MAWISKHTHSKIWEIITRPRPLTSVSTVRKTSNIIHTLVNNKLVDHSDVVGASPVGAFLFIFFFLFFYFFYFFFFGGGVFVASYIGD